ncbi:hypothetical protein CRENBAI_011639 [Crenichthys baileyi]|uniref:Uncharacterized protein n=1 Tax=Crenichthys baileyi TaxID=28760 RepID=A0AAV9R8Y1_9TELE
MHSALTNYSPARTQAGVGGRSDDRQPPSTGQPPTNSGEDSCEGAMAGWTLSGNIGGAHPNLSGGNCPPARTSSWPRGESSRKLGCGWRSDQWQLPLAATGHLVWLRCHIPDQLPGKMPVSGDASASSRQRGYLYYPRAYIMSRRGPRHGDWILHPDLISQIWNKFSRAAVALRHGTMLSASCGPWPQMLLYTFPPAPVDTAAPGFVIFESAVGAIRPPRDSCCGREDTLLQAERAIRSYQEIAQRIWIWPLNRRCLCLWFGQTQ